MQARKTIQHAAFMGSVSADGYTSESYGSAVDRKVFGWQPQILDTTVNADYAKRVNDRVEVLVPSVDPYKPLDRVTLNGLTFTVDQIKDFDTGPFPYRPGGVVVVERTSG